MTEENRGQQDWILLDRIARSLAHSVGNAINVIAGRLSLVEADEALTATSRSSISRAQERLKRLHTDLRGVLKFSAPPEEHVQSRLSETLALLRQREIVTCPDWSELTDCVAAADGTVAASSLPLLRLNTAYSQLAAAPTPWSVTRTQQRQTFAVSLRIPFHSRDVPPDRRALTEPWFSKEAQMLPAAARYGRLLLAESLALLEEAQVAVSIELPASAEGLWSLLLVWPLKAASV